MPALLGTGWHTYRLPGLQWRAAETVPWLPWGKVSLKKKKIIYIYKIIKKLKNYIYIYMLAMCSREKSHLCFKISHFPVEVKKSFLSFWKCGKPQYFTALKDFAPFLFWKNSGKGNEKQFFYVSCFFNFLYTISFPCRRGVVGTGRWGISLKVGFFFLFNFFLPDELIALLI